MEKSREAFRTISEVATWLETPAHVLRFWESRFPEISPIKRAGGRRYYRPEDMQLLGGIKKLLHGDGLTIKAVQKKLASEGVGSVCSFSPPMTFAEIPEPVQDPPTDAISEPRAVPPDVAPPDPRPAPQLATPLRPSDGARTMRFGAPPRTPPRVESPEPTTATAPSPAEDGPAIGFFFDDSLEDDTIIAPLPPFAAPARPSVDAAPAAPHSTPAAPRLSGIAPDPDDDTPQSGPVLSLPARLRELTPGDVQAAGLVSRLTILTRRLEALRHPTD